MRESDNLTALDEAIADGVDRYRRTLAVCHLSDEASAAEAPAADCTIKGNDNRKGERIYHLPGGLNYAKIHMGAAGKRWSYSEEEAEAAGWRPAGRK